MTSNKEWLDNLAATDPQALQAWFDAEHVDAQRDNNGTCPIGNGTASDDAHSKTETLLTEQSLLSDEADSREKLETDLRSLTVSWRDYDGNYMRTYSSVAYAQIKELLERQAAITANANKELITWQAATVARLQNEVDTIKAANDDYRDSYEASSRANEILTLENAQVKTENAKLQAQVDELTQKLDNLSHDLAESERLREEMREELSVAYDHAHDLLARRDRGLA